MQNRDFAVDEQNMRRSVSGTSNNEGRRIPGIDGLRAIAILIVMASHAGLGRVVPGGFGVTVFFFLSGYLITTLLRIERQRSGTVHLGAFYVRRAARILPPLYLTLLLVIVLAFTGLIRAPLNGSSLILDVLFLTNYASIFGVSTNTPIPLWSLDVEEHFYLFFPAFFVVMTRCGFSRLTSALFLICILFLFIRIITFIEFGSSNISYWSHTRIDSVVFGGLLAIWHNPMIDQNAWRPKAVHVFGALLVIILTLAIRSPFFRETVRYSLQGVALFVLFSSAIQSRGLVIKILNGSALRVVALLSYTLYLVHMPLLAITDRLPWLLQVPVAYAIAFVWAGLMYIAIEQPLARWRKRSLERAAAVQM